MDNTKIIFNQKLAGYLMMKSNPLIAIKKDLKMPNKNIFIFKITNKLNQDIDQYIKGVQGVEVNGVPNERFKGRNKEWIKTTT